MNKKALSEHDICTKIHHPCPGTGRLEYYHAGSGRVSAYQGSHQPKGSGGMEAIGADNRTADCAPAVSVHE